MGKIYRLSERPSCFEATIKLIEKSFQYKKPNSFEIDFAPLVDKSNHHNCFILLDENENVVAHIGSKDRFFSLKNETFPVTLLGGIAVDEARRGEGFFQTLFQDVLAEKRSDTSLFLLWSDLEKLYNKYGFHLCGTQFEVTAPRVDSPFIKTTYAALTEAEKKEIQELHGSSFAKNFVTLTRDQNEWDLIAKITSADLRVQKENGKITSYYFQNKGQDLPDVIFEYGSKNKWEEFLTEISSYGKLWVGNDVLPTENLQYQFFMGPGDLRLFTAFISAFTDGVFQVRNVNLMKQEVFFDFNEETLSLELHEFLRGVFGPGSSEELNLKTLFLSGLDSI